VASIVSRWTPELQRHTPWSLR